MPAKKKSRTSAKATRKAAEKRVRYLDIHEKDHLDETQLAASIQQAAALPGWVP